MSRDDIKQYNILLLVGSVGGGGGTAGEAGVTRPLVGRGGRGGVPEFPAQHIIGNNTKDLYFNTIILQLQF